jgi:hypothetical protein
MTSRPERHAPCVGCRGCKAGEWGDCRGCSEGPADAGYAVHGDDAQESGCDTPKRQNVGNRYDTEEECLCERNDDDARAG